MRYFNTHGPVNVQEHYVVPRQALVEQLTAQIEQGKFFTIYAPRQIGKTTLLNALEATLRPRPTYLPIVLNFEAYESWSVEQFWEDVALLINEDLEAWAQTVEQPVRSALQTFLAGAPIADEQSFREAIYTAIDVLTKREEYDLINKNPLAFSKQTADR